MKKGPWLFRVYVWDAILPSYLEMILNHCKDPLQKQPGFHGKYLSCFFIYESQIWSQTQGFQTLSRWRGMTGPQNPKDTSPFTSGYQSSGGYFPGRLGKATYIAHQTKDNNGKSLFLGGPSGGGLENPFIYYLILFCVYFYGFYHSSPFFTTIWRKCLDRTTLIWI